MKKNIIFLCIIIYFLIGCLFFYFENKCIQVTKIDISNNKISEEFNGYTIAQVSDLHSTEFGRNQINLINKLKNQKPNIIVVTGDLIYKRSEDIKSSIEFVEQAVKIAPVYFVSGNHEEQIDVLKKESLYKKLNELGVIILQNESIHLSLNNSHINMIGINDPDKYYDDCKEYDEIVDNILANIKINNKEFNVLLSHRPSLIDLYSKYGYDLVFSGHAHGGQFIIPLLGGLWAPDEGMFPKYTQGLYVLNDTSLIVSRGLGRSIVPLRLFNRPELIICKLNHKATSTHSLIDSLKYFK